MNQFRPIVFVQIKPYSINKKIHLKLKIKITFNWLFHQWKWVITINFIHYAQLIKLSTFVSMISVPHDYQRHYKSIITQRHIYFNLIFNFFSISFFFFLFHYFPLFAWNVRDVCEEGSVPAIWIIITCALQHRLFMWNCAVVNTVTSRWWSCLTGDPLIQYQPSIEAVDMHTT